MIVKDLNVVVKNLEKLKKLDLSQAMKSSAELVSKSAKDNLNYSGRDKDKDLSNSIYTRSDKNTGEVYTSNPKAVWYEFGTGAYAEHGDGRPGWWVWVDPECNAPKSTRKIIYDYNGACACAESLAKLYGADHVHVTQGQPPIRFLRNALEDNKESILELINQAVLKELK